MDADLYWILSYSRTFLISQLGEELDFKASVAWLEKFLNLL